MLINILNILTEAALYLLFFGLTFSNSATEIFAISIIGFFIIKRIHKREFRLPRTPINIFLYVLWAIIFITFLRSAYFSESIRGFLRIIKYSFLFFALVEFFNEDESRLKRAFWAVAVIACFTFLNGIFQAIFNFDIMRHHTIDKDDYLRRIQSSFVHPNDFGAYIIFVLPLLLCFLCPHLKKGRRIFLLINCMLGAYCLVRTSSRGAWLGFFLGVIVYFFFYKKKIAILIPIALVLSIMLFPHGLDRLKALFAFEQNTVWERMQLWKGTWNMIKVHPFLGFGVNTFSRYFIEYKPAAYPDIRYAHNSYLQMWSEIGIFGLLTFLALVITILRQALRGIRNKLREGLTGFVLLGLASGYIAFLIQSGLDTNLFSLTVTTLFWIMSAYLISLNKLFGKKG